MQKTLVFEQGNTFHAQNASFYVNGSIFIYLRQNQMGSVVDLGLTQVKCQFFLKKHILDRIYDIIFEMS